MTSSVFFFKTKDMDLFDIPGQQPLAARMRPRNLDEYIGQSEILGEGRLLRRVIQADRLGSLIFYGPPGTGKTTLAQVIANTTQSAFASLNAVLSGIKELREEIEKAKERKTLYNRRTILFVDEVHRWNKAQQDALLPWVENGTVILIGATTENPYFEVNKALVSRSRIFRLTSLSEEELRRVAMQAVGDRERGYGKFNVVFEEGALEHLIQTAEGDARNLLNALELAVETTPERFPPKEGSEIRISLATAEESIQQKAVLYDKEGDYHYDIISAFIKSLRGSDPDAALYWMARMTEAGENPRFLFRRMLILACEDVGLADPNAIRTVEACAAAFDRIGMPEGNFMLSLAALYLSTCPKSNSTLAFFDAVEAVRKERNGEVPDHLKDPSRDGDDFGHGKGYLYPHAYRDHWTAQQYLPKSLQGRIFYQPGKLGYEAQIADDVRRRREIQLSQTAENDETDVLTFAFDKEESKWLLRMNRDPKADGELRDDVLNRLPWKRHFNVLDVNAGGGFFVWEALRRSTEGSVYALTATDSEKEIIDFHASELDEVRRPIVISDASFENRMKRLPEKIRFEIILARELFLKSCRTPETAALLRTKAAENGRLLVLQTLPRFSTRLSQLLPPLPSLSKPTEQMRAAEEKIYSDRTNPLLTIDSDSLTNLLEAAGWETVSREEKEIDGFRSIPKERIESWFSPDGLYGRRLEQETAAALKALCLDRIAGRNHPWRKRIFIAVFKAVQPTLP